MIESTEADRDLRDPADGEASWPATGAGHLHRYRADMRRFAASFASLPAETQATCPTCRDPVRSVFDRVGEQVVLTYHCGRCGDAREVHHDTIWTHAVSDRPGSPTHTFHGSPIRPILRRFPRTVETLCPDCSAIIPGRYFVEDGAVHIEKACPEHGHVRDCVNSDALLAAKAAWWSFEEDPGQRFPQVTGGENCPSDCGLCNQHVSSPCLAQIDLTNRCNMRCPVCFANAGAADGLCEPDFDQIRRQLQTLRDLRPTPCTAIQFTGGEPTIHPDFLRIVSTARDMGFSHIQIATNGLMLADYDFARQCHQAGLHTLYLQFDGVGADAHQRTRNYDGLWDKKLAVIENCRRVGMKICLVPTVIRGVTDEQVGKIFHFAVENIDVISGISYQPVSFSGRVATAERARRRYTLGHLAHDISQASGASLLRDIFPLSIVVPLSQILEALTGDPKVRPSVHPGCAMGTYFLISPEGKAYPFPQVVDVEGMFTDMNRIVARIRRRGRPTRLDRFRTFRMFKRHFRPDQAPPGLTVKLFIRSLMGMVDKRVGRGNSGEQNYRTLLCAGMHFQDRYNYDVERTKRCVILYSTPAGVFPFCAYNCGPEYRALVEQAWSKQAAAASDARETARGTYEGSAQAPQAAPQTPENSQAAPRGRP